MEIWRDPSSDVKDLKQGGKRVFRGTSRSFGRVLGRTENLTVPYRKKCVIKISYLRFLAKREKFRFWKLNDYRDGVYLF